MVLLTERKIANIGAFLRNSLEDEIVIRTSYMDAGWHDIEFDANRAGFNVYRFINKELQGFNECYRFVRKK